MRSFSLILLALACPVGMCLIPMLLMRARGRGMSCHTPAAQSPADADALRSEIAALRAELDARAVSEP